ncbi:hypothetical protein ILYODFUR_029654 [Ilyodon furcidens]|uniref:Uncharacterized protein n=1 Tax=Ilyodon furcidens TaxID=33524 RepID=A0ABV0V755_9TELE
MVETVEEVRPVTGGLPVRTHTLPVSVVVSLSKTLHPPCVLMVVKETGGADCTAASLLSVFPRAAVATLQLTCVSGWMTDFCGKTFGVSGDLIKRYISLGHLPFISVLLLIVFFFVYECCILLCDCLVPSG